MPASISTGETCWRPRRHRSVGVRMVPHFPARMRTFWLAVMLVITASLPSARGSETVSGGWQFGVTPYIWLAGLDGEVGLRGFTVRIDASFIDILESSDSLIGFQGHFEARYGRWGGFIDGTYLKLGADDIAEGPTTVDVKNELALVEFAALYRLGERPLGRGIGNSMAERGPQLAIDLYAGGRVTALEVELEFARIPSRDRSQEWVDPILGGRFTVDLYRNFQLLISGDIGGFGVGSHFAGSAMGLIGYRFQMLGLGATAHAGYRALSQNFEDRSGEDVFRWEVLMHGPILGLSIRF